MYTCNIWYCYSSWWPVGAQLTLCTKRPPGTLVESDSNICCVQLHPPEDEHLRLETCKGE